MNSTLYWLPILAWSAIGSALQGPGPGDVVELGSLKSRVPADWALETPDETQVYKQFRLEPVNDDEYSAQVTVTFVGKKKAVLRRSMSSAGRACFFLLWERRFGGRPRSNN